MFRFWKEDSAEARDFSTVLAGLLSESTQGAADPNELLRIASEALTNVRKHAKAREASLDLGIVRRRLQLRVSDTGVGFRDTVKDMRTSENIKDRRQTNLHTNSAGPHLIIS